jgi:hypothetical protein
VTNGPVQQLLEQGLITERLQTTVESEFTTSKRSFQRIDKLSTEDTTENFSGGEERFSALALLAVNPVGTVRRQAATGDDRMHVRMMEDCHTIP